MCLRTTTRLALLLLFAPLFATVSVSSGFCAQTADRGGVGSAAHGMPSKSRKGGGAACGQLGQEAASSSGKRRKGGGSASAPGVSQKDLPSPSVVGVAHADAGNNGQLLTVPGVLSEAECASWVAWAESLGMVSTRPAGGRPGYGDAYRDNFRAQVHDRGIADALWDTGLGRALEGVLPALKDGRQAVGFNDNIRLYRYDPGLRFGKHYDGADVDSLGRETRYTVLIYLSSCGGGETCFYNEHGGQESARITPVPGLALLHRHGVDCWQHEARPVTQGTKYILRTDVVYARKKAAVECARPLYGSF